MARIAPEIQDYHRANAQRLRAAARGEAWTWLWRWVQKHLGRWPG